MSAEAIEKSEQYIVLAGNERPEDVPSLIAKLDLPGQVGISFRHVGGMTEGFLGALLEGLSAAGVTTVRAIEPTPHELKFMNLVAECADLKLVA